MKIIDLSFCNKEYAQQQANTYSTWKNYSDWSNYIPTSSSSSSAPHHKPSFCPGHTTSSSCKTQCGGGSERLKKMTDTDRTNCLKQVDYVQFRVKKPKHYQNIYYNSNNNNNNSNVSIRRDYNYNNNHINNIYKTRRTDESNDIENWSMDQVKRWISYTCHSHSLPAPYPVENYLMNGRGLLMLTKKDFIHRSPLCGDILYESLVNIRLDYDCRQKDYQTFKTVNVNDNNNNKSFTKKEYSNYMPAYEVEYIDEQDDKLYDYLQCLNNISLNSIGLKSNNNLNKPKYSNAEYFHYSTFQ